MLPNCQGYYLLSCQDQIWAMLSLDLSFLEDIISPLDGLGFWNQIRYCFGRFNGAKLNGLGYNNLVNPVISFDNTLAGIIAGKNLLDYYSVTKISAELATLRRDVENMEEYILSQGGMKQTNRMVETGFGSIEYPLANLGTSAWYTFYSFCYNPFKLS